MVLKNSNVKKKFGRYNVYIFYSYYKVKLTLESETLGNVEEVVGFLHQNLPNGE